MNKNIMKIIFILIGTIIGAGFASGKEIFLFFSKYGNIGIIGAIFSNLLTSVIVYKTIRLINFYNLESYNSLINVITNKKDAILNKIFSIIINIFVYISFIIMLSGFGAFFYETYNINNFVSILIVALICFYLFNTNINNIVKINTILIPFLIIIIFILSIKKLNISLDYMNVSTNINWIIDCILYSSYNSILLIPVIISLNKLIYGFSIKQIKLIAFFIFFILTLLSISIINLLFSLDNSIIKSLEIPVLYISKNFGNIYHFLYGFTIIIAIFTSAISTGYSCVSIFKNKTYYKYISFIICFSSVLFYKINFSTLVSCLYPIFGFLGILQILYLLLKKIPKTDINIIENRRNL